MAEQGFVYVTRNLLNGKIYVGIHTCWRKHYLGSGVYLNNAIRKHGKESFVRTTIDEFDSLDVGLAKERYWIEKLNSKYPSGYNLNDGGGGNFNPVQETRDKISRAKAGKPSCNKGKKMSEAQKKKIGDAHRGKPGRTWSEEEKEHLRAINKGKTLSDEHKRKISKAHIGKRKPSKRKGIKLSEDYRQKISRGLIEWWKRKKDGDNG